MKSWIKIAVISILLAGAGVAFGLSAVYWYYCASPTDEYWSTESPAVRQELDDGFKDLNRGYFPDAAMHFERVLELEPKNAAATALLAHVNFNFPKEREELLARLAKTNRSSLSDFEQLLVDLAPMQRLDAMLPVVDNFLEKHPHDPFARNFRCDFYWEGRRWDEAEACHRALLEDHPEWVNSQRRLGDLSMSRGLFREAEDHYLTYRFVAPDQAAPYYQLGQLYLFLGRYEESEQAQRKALELKPDYCQAYSGLVHLYIFWNRLDDLERTLQELDQQPNCSFNKTSGISCTRQAYLTYLRGHLAEAYAQYGTCQRGQKWSLVGHHLAVAAGDFAQAREIEGILGKEVAQYPENTFLSGYLHHNQGVRRLAQGDLPGACEELTVAAKETGYWAGEVAFVVLMNRVYQVACFEKAGLTAEAAKARAEVAEFNPRLLDTFKLPDFSAASPGR